VRIALDAKEIAAHPLRIGLSMMVEVNTREQDEAKLGTRAEVQAARIETADAGIEQARVKVREIIRQNLAHG